MRKIKIPLPPLPEQEKIASILSKVDEQIEETERIIEKTELLKKGLMQKLFVYGTENKKLKEIDVKYSPKKWIIPENWTTKQLEEITYKITDGTHLTPKYTDKGIPFLRVKDIHSDSIDWSSVKYISKKEHNELIKRCNPKRGDILLSKNGTIGIPKIVDWDREFSIFVSLCLIKVKSKIININYLYYLLKSDMIFNQYLLRSKTGTVTNLHIEEIKNLTIIIPPLPEQEKIASILSKVDTQLQDNHNYLNKLEELKKGLMQDLLTGKVRVCV
ncbi:MAG: restriction endonuclease subunit S [Methanosarcinaceae archaeon]|nr:restriction endonuclease subunit S [Methanosarcinaceae archaeon]